MVAAGPSAAVSPSVVVPAAPIRVRQRGVRARDARDTPARLAVAGLRPGWYFRASRRNARFSSSFVASTADPKNQRRSSSLALDPGRPWPARPAPATGERASGVDPGSLLPVLVDDLRVDDLTWRRVAPALPGVRPGCPVGPARPRVRYNTSAARSCACVKPHAPVDRLVSFVSIAFFNSSIAACTAVCPRPRACRRRREHPSRPP